MKIGITGATGQLGRLIVENLKTKTSAAELVALVRSPEKATDLGIEARSFDYTKPEGMAEALKGIDYLMLISASEIGSRTAQHTNIIEAAKQANIKWIVYTSLVNAGTSTLNLAEEHRASEALIQQSGIPYTILRNGWYTENYTASIPGTLKAGALLGSAGEGKISSATRQDYAEAAAAVLTQKGHEGKTYELAGDEFYTLANLAAEISKQSGKEISYVNLPEAEYAEKLKSFGIRDHYAAIIANMDAQAGKDQLYSNSKDLSKLIGRPTTPLSVVVKNAIA